MSVKNAMSTEVISIRPNDRVIDAWLLMMETAVSSMPVVSESGSIVGILSITDINRHIAERVAKARSLRELTARQPDPELEDKEEIRELVLAIRAVAESAVSSILPKDQKIHGLSPEDSLERAIHMMAENNVNMLPVLKDGGVVGIVTRQDVIWVVAGKSGKHPTS
jgi:CBS domain-containing protein